MNTNILDPRQDVHVDSASAALSWNILNLYHRLCQEFYVTPCICPCRPLTDETGQEDDNCGSTDGKTLTIGPCSKTNFRGFICMKDFGMFPC